MVDRLKRDWRSVELPPRIAAIAAYAEKLTLTPNKMQESDLKSLRDNGLDDSMILDLVQVIGYFNYINRIASSLGVPAEAEFDPEIQTPGEV